MKKILALLLTFALLMALSACDVKVEVDPTSSEKSSFTAEVSSLDSSDEPVSSKTQSISSTVESSELIHTHTYSKATCTEPAKCFCGATEGRALGHSFTAATCTEPKKCKTCGVTEGLALRHRFSEATCTSASVCTKCGISIGIALGHDYSSATCTKPQICNRCGNIKGTALGHNFSDATCTTPQICYRCEATADSALGHNFVNQKCTRCGKLDRTYLIEDIDYLTKSSYTEYTQDMMTDNQGTEYSGHYTFYSTWNGSSIEFETKGKYKTFTGTAFLSYYDRAYNHDVRVKIYSDGKLLYQTNPLAKGCNPETFSVDITGVSILIIELEANTFTANQGSIYTQNAMLTNAYLSK